ncbi:uncharacterized protein LOC135494715 [Lineus longissimus]|uniref:uncharacterized protein LOC135494715 n=1 Tax=Lineus longissimus TaxID=88925 RepID=UPI002B4DF4B8
MMFFHGTWICIFLTAVLAEVHNLVLTVRPSVSTVNEGYNTDVNCSVVNKINPALPVYWKALGKYQQQPITENCHVNQLFHRTFNLSECQHKNDSGHYVLHLRSVQWNDSGMYECAYDGRADRVALVVYTKIRDMEITQSLKGANAFEYKESITRMVHLPPGAILYLNCTTGCAYPSPTIKWKLGTSMGHEKQVPRANYSTKSEKCSSPPPMYVGAYVMQARVMSTLTIYGKNITGTRHAKVERYSCIASNSATGAFTTSEFSVEFAGNELGAVLSIAGNELGASSQSTTTQTRSWPLFVITVVMTTVAKLAL